MTPPLNSETLFLHLIKVKHTSPEFSLQAGTTESSDEGTKNIPALT
jgi:hypothetical protein